jgi:ATP-dependent RNA helicase DeaD
VLNYDIPYDVEAYVHRIGRTGRAGRQGDAILFAANRERRLLRAIEKSTGGAIEKMELPTAEDVADTRIKRFKARISETLASTDDLDRFRALVEQYQHEYGVPVIEVAAALVAMAQDKQPLFAREKPRKSPERRAEERDKRREKARQKEANPVPDSSRRPARDQRDVPAPDKGMVRYRIEVGYSHGVKPGNIVGAIANEAEIDAEYIGRIEIYDDHATVDMPDGMPKEIFRHLKGVWVSGQRLQISKPGDDTSPRRPAASRAGSSGKPRSKKKPAGVAKKKKPQNKSPGKP